MLVSAMGGRENVLNAYQTAIKERYRFYSFGDGDADCLVIQVLFIRLLSLSSSGSFALLLFALTVNRSELC